MSSFASEVFLFFLSHSLTTFFFLPCTSVQPIATELRRVEEEVYSIKDEIIYQKRREYNLRDTNGLLFLFFHPPFFFLAP